MPEPIPVNIAMIPESDFAGRLEQLAATLKKWEEDEVRSRFEIPTQANLLKTTLSLCPSCLNHNPAAVYASKGRVLINTCCSVHGNSKAVLENDERYYHLSNKDRWGRIYSAQAAIEFPAFSGCCAKGSGCDAGEASLWLNNFSDQRSNKSCTVLVEITNACNLSCRVCYADAKGDQILPFLSFCQYINELIRQKGELDSIQITGGEAVLHPRFWQIITWLYEQPGVKKIYLPTNGIEFSKPAVARRLRQMRDKLLVLLQFDGAETMTNQTLRRASPARLRTKLIKQLNRLNVPMQLTMTLAQGISEDEIAWVVHQGVRFKNVRLVAMQPAFFSGRYELEADPLNRLTLSDVVKGIVKGLQGKAKESDFLPIPCSHPNCGWVTLFMRRFGLLKNIARHVDLNAVMNQVAYKTLLNKQEMQQIVGTRKQSWGRHLIAKAGRKLIRPQDVFGIAIKPFMDRFNYDQDRVSACCHHILDTQGRLLSFCEYNARLRSGDDWSRLPRLGETSTMTYDIKQIGKALGPARQPQHPHPPRHH